MVRFTRGCSTERLVAYTDHIKGLRDEMFNDELAGDMPGTNYSKRKEPPFFLKFQSQE
jgi:hypothetical protein